MPITPKDDCKETKVPPESGKTDLWSEDQTSRQYYYDDAHGYENFVDDGADDVPDDESTASDVH